MGYLPIMPVNVRDSAGTSRDKQGQGRNKQGQERDKQGQARTNRVSPFLSLSFPVCPCLSLSIPPCHCQSLSVPVWHCLSLSFPVCLNICYTCISPPADDITVFLNMSINSPQCLDLTKIPGDSCQRGSPVILPINDCDVIRVTVPK